MIDFLLSEWSEIFVGGICTLAIYSFLIKENPFYRFFEHSYIGIATGIGVVLAFSRFIWPKIFKPMFGYEVSYFPDGTVAQAYEPMYQLYLIPASIGLLVYFILTKKRAWLALIPIGIGLGESAGRFFRGFFNQIMPQLYDSFKPLYVDGPLREQIGNIVFVAVLISSLFYFFFTFPRKKGGAVERVSTAGRWMMMGCFGAFFGTTIMARMALLVERIQFFIDQWIPTVLLGAL